tara:strand:+ start:272 stop:838 length:567 start_codon:yes stop_codon:yes gene_type:complete
MECKAFLPKGWSDYGIVLGGGITKNYHLSSDVRSRIEKAYFLLKNKYVKKLILTGNGSKITEAKLFYDYLIEKGVNKKDLILEEHAKDTIGNAIFTKKIMLKKRVRNFVLVTSDYHMKRSLMIFMHIFGHGYNFIGVASNLHPVHKLHLFFTELRSLSLDTFILSKVKIGDHIKAEKLIRKLMPIYRK